jgi:hypothetical protein
VGRPVAISMRARCFSRGARGESAQRFSRSAGALRNRARNPGKRYRRLPIVAQPSSTAIEPAGSLAMAVQREGQISIRVGFWTSS